MKIKIKLFLVFTLIAFTAQPAFAYIDPGSGSAIMSVIIGFFCCYWCINKNFLVQNKEFF